MGTMSPARLRGEAHASIYERFLYSDLSDKAVRLLCVLDRCQNLGLAYPGRAWLAGKMGCSTDTIDRVLHELEATSAIVTSHTKRPGGGHPLVTYYVWPALPDENEQLRMDAELQVRTHADLQVGTHADSSPHPRGKSRGRTVNSKQEKVKESLVAKATDDPMTACAHRLTVKAYEQPVKPSLANANGHAFAAVLGIIRSQLEAGHTDKQIERAVLAGVGVWTIAGLQTAIAQANPRSRANADRDPRNLPEMTAALAEAIQRGETT